MKVDYPGQQNQDFRFLRPRIEREHWERALDAGCGSGLYTRVLAKHADFATGIDSSIAAIKGMPRSNSAPPGVVGVLQQLPYSDDRFDLVMSIEVVSHVPRANQEATVAELLRVLRPGGTLIISVHNLTRHRLHRFKRRVLGSLQTSGAPIFPLSIRGLTRLLEEAGLEVRPPIRHVNFFNRFSFELANRRPKWSSFLAWIENRLSNVPGLRELSITLLVEGVKPAG